MAHETKGELGVQATSGGRRITLDPVMETAPLELERRRVESTIPCGFQVNWIDGTFEKDGETWHFDLGSGAGFGSRWMTLCLKRPDGTVFAYECADMAAFLEKWLDSVLEDGPSPEREKNDATTNDESDRDGTTDPNISSIADGLQGGPA